MRPSHTIPLLFLACIVASAQTQFNIVKDGRSEAVIVSLQNDEAVNSSAKLFSRQVAKSTGAYIPVSTTPVAGKLNIILVKEDRSVDKRDAFSITFPNAYTMNIKGTRDSIAYALDYILERDFGVRRLTMNYSDFRWKVRPEAYSRDFEVDYQRLYDVSIPCFGVMQNASFNFKRDIYTHTSGWKTRSAFPGTHDIAKWAFPPSKYAENNSWPKEILPVHNGKRYVMKSWGPQKNAGIFKVGWQPCWSNPKTTEIAVANILEQLEAAKKKSDVYSINLDINDGGGCCQCEKCQAAVGGKINSVGRLNYSNLYWKWINGIAEKVTERFPELYINCLAYREVLEAPDFNLHPNVIPQICRELTAVQNQSIRNEIIGLFLDWSIRAHTVFLWDYQYGAAYYLFPRIYFHQQAELFKTLHGYKVRGVFIEGNDFFGMEGPKHYINAKLLWNVNEDVDALLEEWCESCGGKAAAPYLMEYYTFWEDYWQRPEIQKTGWFASSTATYMQLGEQGTYTYALEKGDMAKLRKLMEGAADAAETPLQKQRTAFLRDYVFTISENAAKCLYSEFIQPDGSLASASDALALLKSVPDAVNALNALKGNALLSSRLLAIAEGGLVSNVNSVMPFITDAEVKSEIQKLSETAALPSALQTQFKIMLGAKFTNLVGNGSFEANSPLPPNSRRNTERASDGEASIKMLNGAVEMVAKGITPSKTYYIGVDVYAGNPSGEGLFSVQLAPRVEKTTTDWKRLKNIKLQKGWQTVSFAYQVAEKNHTNKPVDNFLLQILANGFEADEPLWIDNVRIYCID